MSRQCFIDDCTNNATLIVESYPDDILLCDEHRFLRGEPEPWDSDYELPDTGTEP